MQATTHLFGFLAGITIFVAGQTQVLASSEIISDEFSVGLLDSRIWEGVLVSMDYENKGVVFGEKGQLLTRISLPPKVIIKGRVQPGCISGDQFSTYLRTDGSFRNGIVVEFKLGGGWPENAFGGKNIQLYEAGGNRVEADYPIQAYATYDFKIVDNSTNVVLYLNDLNKPLLTLATAKRFGYRLGFLKNGSTTPDTELYNLDVTVEADSSLTNAPFETTNITTALENLPQVSLSSNNYVKITGGEGELILVDSDGVLLRGEDSHYDKIKWEQISDDDMRVLLLMPKIFSAVAAFGSAKFNPDLGSKNNYDPSILEQSLRALWSRGNSLQGRIKARLTVFDFFQKYNESRANFLKYKYSGEILRAASKSLATRESQAWHNSMNASEYEDAENWVTYHPGDLSDYSRQAFGIINANIGKNPDSASADKDLNKIIDLTTKFDAQSKSFWSLAQPAGSDMFLYANKLNAIGFTINTKAPFLAIPTINIPQEIVAELNSATNK
jgi:hypothetical protein